VNWRSDGGSTKDAAARSEGMGAEVGRLNMQKLERMSEVELMGICWEWVEVCLNEKRRKKRLEREAGTAEAAGTIGTVGASNERPSIDLAVPLQTLEQGLSCAARTVDVG